MPIRARTSPALMPKNQCNWNRVFFNTSLALFVQIDSARRALCRGVVEKHSFLRTKAPFTWMNGACGSSYRSRRSEVEVSAQQSGAPGRLVGEVSRERLVVVGFIR